VRVCVCVSLGTNVYVGLRMQFLETTDQFLSSVGQ
jgi:hypothetical protein